MKVTDEMVEAAYGVVGLPEQRIRDVLEAALADVPDHEAKWVEASSRALVAEAKLAKVREWARGPLAGGIVTTLLDILEDE